MIKDIKKLVYIETVKAVREDTIWQQQLHLLL